MNFLFIRGPIHKGELKKIHSSGPKPINENYILNKEDGFYFKYDKSEIFSIFQDKKNSIFVFFSGFFLNKKELSQRVKLANLVKEAQIIHALYVENGLDFFDFVDGFFTGIIFDAQKNKLFLFSDHIASEQTLYTKIDNKIFISSNIENLNSLLKTKTISQKRIKTFFEVIHSKEHETFFEEVYRIGAGEVVLFQENKKLISKYHNFDLTKYNHLNYEDDFAKLHSKFFKYSVEGCMQFEVGKIGSALSGGLDSSSITSVASELNKEKITSFTATFNTLDGKDYKKSYELDYAMEVINKFKIDHEFVDMKDTGAITYLAQNLHHHSEPDLLVNGYIHENIFKRLQAHGINHYMDGYGGDSIISHGYNHLHELGSNLKILSLLTEAKKLHNFYNKKLPIFRVLKEYVLLNFLPDYIHWCIKCQSNRPPKQKVWRQRLSNSHHTKSTYQNLKEIYSGYPLKINGSAKLQHSKEVVSPIISLSIQSVKLLARKYNIEINFPFLSKKLMELSINTPVKFKLKNGQNRSIFREAMKGTLPQKIVERGAKSDLSPLSEIEISKISFDEVKKLAHAHCPTLFDIDFLSVLFKDPKNYIFEIYQVYSFLKWLNYNDLKV